MTDSPATVTGPRSIFIRSDIEVARPHELIDWYMGGAVSRGPDYYGRRSVMIGDPDAIEFGDLAWAVLLEGRPSSRAAQSLLHASPISLAGLSSKPLGQLTRLELDAVVETIVALVALDGFGSSIATKILHVKRRHTVPVLDNQAIYASFANPDWKVGSRHFGGSERRRSSIAAALIQVQSRMVDPASADGWSDIIAHATNKWGLELTKIEAFDICWWGVVRAGDETLSRAGVAQRSSQA